MLQSQILKINAQREPAQHVFSLAESIQSMLYSVHTSEIRMNISHKAMTTILLLLTYAVGIIKSREKFS